jgi:hypothetical protein
LFGLPLADGRAAPDITLALAGVPPWKPSAVEGLTVRYRTSATEARPDDNLIVYELADGFVFRYADATEFYLARDGRAIWATWAPASTLADTETYLLGPVLGFAQRLMGTLCLHASAVIVDGAAIALCGPAYAGKSTTAGAFAAAGYGMLADDMTALRVRGEQLLAMPAYDHLRVWQESERILLGTSGALPRLTPSWEKLALNVRGQGWTWSEESAPLRAIVLLAPRVDAASAPRVDAVPAGEAFVHLAANSYANYLLDERMRAEEFAALARVMSSASVLRATPHADPARIGDLVRAIVDAVRA